MLIKTLLAKVIEKNLNRLLKLDGDLQYTLAPLQNQPLAINITDLKLRLTFIPQENHFLVHAHMDEAAKATISGALLDIIKIGLTESPQALFASDKLEVNGKVGTLQAYQKFATSLDLDWESYLSRWLGPAMGPEIAKGIRKTHKFAKNATDTTLLDITEYLQEEIKLTPAREQVSDLKEAVHELRLAVDRFEARLSQSQG